MKSKFANEHAGLHHVTGRSRNFASYSKTSHSRTSQIRKASAVQPKPSHELMLAETRRCIHPLLLSQIHQL